MLIAGAVLAAGCVRLIGHVGPRGDGLAADGPADAAPGDRRSPDSAPPLRLEPSWAFGFGAAEADVGAGIAVDTVGNITITGSFRGAVDFGGGALTSAGGADVFVASYDAKGAHRWSKRFGGGGQDAGHAVALDSGGNVFVVGACEGSVTFGGPAVGGAGSADAFVVSLDATGAHRWSRALGGSGYDAGLGVTVDPNGDVAATGTYQGTVDFGDGPVTSLGGDDVFVVGLDAKGTPRWSRVFGSAGSDAGHGVGAAGNGYVTVTGRYAGSTSFGASVVASAGGNDIFVASYGPLSLHRWSRGVGFPLADVGYDVAVDSGGEITVTGAFSGTVNFGDDLITSSGGQDLFVARYGPDGAALWSTAHGGPGNEAGRGVALDGVGNIVITGAFDGTTDLGGGALTSAGGSDVFVAIYGPSGAHRFSLRFGGTGDDGGSKAAVDRSGNVALVGSFAEEVDLGGGGKLKSAGATDVFLVQLAP